MASDLLKAMEEEVMCPICLSYLRDPIFIDCGHIFCRGCVNVICEPRSLPLGEGPSCPLCKTRFRQETVKPAWQAANIVKGIKDLRLNLEEQTGEEQRCVTHGEKLHFHCEDDGQLLCVVCRESREHRLHKVSVIKEAIQAYKNEIQIHVQTLQKERSQLRGFQAVGERKTQALMGRMEVERRKMVSEFEQIHQFLEGREHLLLGKLEELEQDIRKGREELVAAASAELAQLEALITELEEKSQQEEAELLQGVKGSVSRFQQKKFLKLNPVSQLMERKVNGLTVKINSLQKNFKEFQGKLQRELESDLAGPGGDPSQNLKMSDLHLRSNSVSWFLEGPFHSFSGPSNPSPMPGLPHFFKNQGPPNR
ncbi:tripartite motif-containing protein 26-like [Ornithorhynchus anatinus]|uniref:Uncharacterized protein n=1 Tax=Ornithorhynchus anatinus TaxID=9258 RepID=A0A6I8MXR1_ORNAN|nr:tripartite motif-containing protein 26-like [Ornithorhynchus anatinus]XP_028910756.1 tripartite motif-containing protein 26-like [Ornithorhynchus anatinus]XP_028910757.1 tripartite motif-containing protein 26-like [Ornithorhynchus anatinus]XP_039766883.1 tripartite motif-containing protein 26-like [Ornithorhynchus anatinus]